MKVTVNKKVDKKVDFKTLEPGTIVQVGEKMFILRLRDDKNLLLTYSAGMDWFDLSDGSIERNSRPKKVLGKISEIIVG